MNISQLLQRCKVDIRAPDPVLRDHRYGASKTYRLDFEATRYLRKIAGLSQAK